MILMKPSMPQFRDTFKVILLAWFVSLGIVFAILSLFFSLFVVITIGIIVMYLSSPTYADRDEGIGILLISFGVSFVITFVVFISATVLIYKTQFLQRLWAALEQRFILDSSRP